MTNYQNIVFLFPGQGAQYVGMGKSLYQKYSAVRQTFEESSDLLKQDIAALIFESDEQTLAKTINSQIAIYVYSLSIVRLLQQLLPKLRPSFCAGLSLGEYSALAAAEKLSFATTLSLVQHRATYMSQACVQNPGTMAVIMGLDAKSVKNMVLELNMPQDLWAANFNCPGQVVISGTHKGIEAGCLLAKNKGAKRTLPLSVEGAFHSGLMTSAQEKLAPYIESITLQSGCAHLVMNCPAQIISETNMIKHYLIAQVTHAIEWQQSIELMQQKQVDLYIEIGCGKTLSGMNKRIGVTAPSMSLDSIEEIKKLQEVLIHLS